jgi:hypothetical protein
MNDALITLLPGDGCVQVLDRVLQKQIRMSMTLAYAASVLFALSFSISAVFRRGLRPLILSAAMTILAFLTAAITHLRHGDHLTGCDMFLFGSDAPFLNFLAAAVCLVLTVGILLQTRGKSPRHGA